MGPGARWFFYVIRFWVSLAVLGQTQQSPPTMQLFVGENPNHPLSNDARLVIDELS
jgi:hypothetical protein